jgi:Ran GTPase-activating protein (RanGAP) involved in mRNA processing and transport
LGRENQAPVAAVLSGLSRLTHLEELDLNGNGRSQESVPALCSALQRMPSLRELMIQNNQLGNLGSRELACCLSAHNKQLETLWIQNNSLDAAGKVELKKELSSLTNLSRIEVGQD